MASSIYTVRLKRWRVLELLAVQVRSDCLLTTNDSFAAIILAGLCFLIALLLLIGVCREKPIFMVPAIIVMVDCSAQQA